MSAKNRNKKMKNRQRRQKKNEWTPFEKVTPLSRQEARQVIMTSKAIEAKEMRDGVKMSQNDREQLIEQSIDELLNCTTYVNNLYQVARYEPSGEISEGVGIIHLSIKRLDKEPITNWNHLQRIKNEIVGPEHEACELFPAESRLVNLANQYHLWVLSDTEARFPFGFNDGRNVQDQVDGSTAKQSLEQTDTRL